MNGSLREKGRARERIFELLRQAKSATCPVDEDELAEIGSSTFEPQHEAPRPSDYALAVDQFLLRENLDLEQVALHLAFGIGVCDQGEGSNDHR